VTIAKGGTKDENCELRAIVAFALDSSP
jgi:hypothetical protein